MTNNHGYDFIFGLNAIKKNLGNDKYEKTLRCLLGQTRCEILDCMVYDEGVLTKEVLAEH